MGLRTGEIKPPARASVVHHVEAGRVHGGDAAVRTHNAPDGEYHLGVVNHLAVEDVVRAPGSGGDVDVAISVAAGGKPHYTLAV